MTSALPHTFAALGDPVRFAIVQRLAEADATVGELAGMFEITIQGVSQHLGVLERSGLVSRHREGRSRRVQLEREALDDASVWLEARRQRLEERYRRLDVVLAQLTNKEEKR